MLNNTTAVSRAMNWQKIVLHFQDLEVLNRLLIIPKSAHGSHKFRLPVQNYVKIFIVNQLFVKAVKKIVMKILGNLNLKWLPLQPFLKTRWDSAGIT